MEQQSRGLAVEIKARALSLGFSLTGIASPGPAQSHDRYTLWLEKRHNAGMAYLNSLYHRRARLDPALLYPDLRSIIVVGLTYPLVETSDNFQENFGRISGYAAGEDYHTRFPAMVKPLCDLLRDAYPELPPPEVFTDSAPILERELAVRAGLGWIGRNSCVISPQYGSSFLLAEVFTAVPLKPDPTFTRDLCGTCTRCVDACPTHCIQPDRTIDAGRCISYLTIENKAEIPEELSSRLGEWVFGCDVCQVVCPWNQRPFNRGNTSETLNTLSVSDMINLLHYSQEDFVIRFSASAINRAKLNGLKRNILVWIGNHPSPKAIECVKQLLEKEYDPMLVHTAQNVLLKIECSNKIQPL